MENEINTINTDIDYISKDVVNYEIERLRWGEKSKSILRTFFDDEKKHTIKEIAEHHQVMPQHVHTLKNRFFKLLEKSNKPGTTEIEHSENVSVEEYMAKNPPRLSKNTLLPYTNSLLILRNKGYSYDQLLDFLKSNEITVSMTTLSNFFSNLKSLVDNRIKSQKKNNDYSDNQLLKDLEKNDGIILSLTALELLKDIKK